MHKKETFEGLFKFWRIGGLSCSLAINGNSEFCSCDFHHSSQKLSSLCSLAPNPKTKLRLEEFSQNLYIKKRPLGLFKFWRIGGLSCSLAINGNSEFCSCDFHHSSQKLSSLCSLAPNPKTKLRLEEFSQNLYIKKRPLGLFKFWRIGGSNS